MCPGPRITGRSHPCLRGPVVNMDIIGMQHASGVPAAGLHCGRFSPGLFTVGLSARRSDRVFPRSPRWLGNRNRTLRNLSPDPSRELFKSSSCEHLFMLLRCGLDVHTDCDGARNGISTRISVGSKTLAESQTHPIFRCGVHPKPATVFRPSGVQVGGCLSMLLICGALLRNSSVLPAGTVALRAALLCS